jgi:hypothetical protein
MSGVCSGRRRIASCQTRRRSRARRRASNARRSTDKQFASLGEPFARLAVLFAAPRDCLHPSTSCVQSCVSRAPTKHRTLTRSLSDDALSMITATASLNILPYSRADWRSLVADFPTPE